MSFGYNFRGIGASYVISAFQVQKAIQLFQLIRECYSELFISVQWRMFLDLKGAQMGQWTRLPKCIRPIWFKKHQVPLYPHGRSIHGCAGSIM